MNLTLEQAVARLQGRYDQDATDVVVGAWRADAAPPAAAPRRQHMTLMLDPRSVDRFTRSIPVIASTPDAVGGQAAIRTWDLTRFLKNPVVLWAHDATKIPIGAARDIDPANPAGLAMRIQFATSNVSEVAEQVWNGILEDVVKAVSVGFDMTGPDSAELVELSVVSIGLDEDAGTPSLNPGAAADPSDEERARAVREAAAVMARHLHRARARKRIMSVAGGGGRPAEGRMDLADGEVLRMDVAPLRLDAMKQTPSGGREIKARLTRVGVLMYRDAAMPDGWRRELRLPEDVFNADSLATLEHAPLIDIKDHTGMVTPDTWKRASYGHVARVRADGDYVDSTIHLNDRDGLDAVAKGERRDVSCGYKCRLEWKSGEWRGQKYDCIQRDHVYNHVALCPPNGGRAGTDVGVRADSGDSNLPQWGVSHWDSEEQSTMNTTIKIRLDGRDIDFGSQDHLDTVDRMHKAEVAGLTSAHAKTVEDLKAEHKNRLDAIAGERDAAVQGLTGFKADKAEADKEAEAKQAKADVEKKRERSARRQLERHAFRLLSRVKPDDEAADDEDETDEDGKKKNPFAKNAKRAAKLDSFLDEATDRQIMERVIRSLPGGEKFDAKDRADVYVQARYDTLMETVGQTLGNGLADVVGTIREAQQRTDAIDAGGGDALAVMKKAREARDKAASEAGRVPAAR